jgi:starch phosphorylase
VAEVLELYRNRTYRSFEVYQNDWRIRRIFDEFINSQPNLIGKAEFPNIYDSLITYGDEFFVLKDFSSYVNAQKEVNQLYTDKKKWAHMSAMNIAYAGRFSSDEVIRIYDRDIWKLSGGGK